MRKYHILLYLTMDMFYIDILVYLWIQESFKTLFFLTSKSFCQFRAI